MFSNLSGKVRNHLIEGAVMHFSEFVEVNSHKHTRFPENDVSGRKMGDVGTLERLAGMLHFEWNLNIFPPGKRT